MLKGKYDFSMPGSTGGAPSFVGATNIIAASRAMDARAPAMQGPAQSGVGPTGTGGT